MTYEELPLVPMSPHDKQGTHAFVTPMVQRPSQLLQLDPPSCRDRMYKPIVNKNDVSSLLAVLACLTLAVLAVVDSSFAVRLGQTNQLIVLGLILSVMSAITLQRAHSLLLLLEARFGASTIQNYDAILCDAKFASQSSTTIKLALLTLFVLPLGLSASYKRYVGGRTMVSLSSDETVLFAPSGPPGSFAAGGRSLFANVTSALYAGGSIALQEDQLLNTSFGLNMHVINETTTAMLDIPIVTDDLRSKLVHDTILTISAPVNATFARLNSTPDTPERQDPGYWTGMAARFGANNIVNKPTGQGTWFAMWSGWVDNSLIFLSYYNTTTNESFYDKAVGFNIYRGTAHGTWRISSGSIVLEQARDFQTDFSPNTRHFEVTGAAGCDETTTPDSPQKIIFCCWGLLSGDYTYAIQDYLTDNWFVETGRTTAVVAAMGWASRVGKIGNLGLVAPEYEYLLQTPKYRLSGSYLTMHRNVGLFATLATQPLLLVVVVLVRMLFRSTPVSDDFGLIALLAGVRRQSLDTLKGASYSGKLKEQIVVHIVVRDDGQRRKNETFDVSSRQRQEHGPVIEYALSGMPRVSPRRTRLDGSRRSDDLRYVSTSS